MEAHAGARSVRAPIDPPQRLWRGTVVAAVHKPVGRVPTCLSRRPRDVEGGSWLRVDGGLRASVGGVRSSGCASLYGVCAEARHGGRVAPGDDAVHVRNQSRAEPGGEVRSAEQPRPAIMANARGGSRALSRSGGGVELARARRRCRITGI